MRTLKHLVLNIISGTSWFRGECILCAIMCARVCAYVCMRAGSRAWVPVRVRVRPFVEGTVPSSSAYPRSGRGGISRSKEAQTPLSPATSSSSSGGPPRRSQASRET